MTLKEKIENKKFELECNPRVSPTAFQTLLTKKYTPREINLRFIGLLHGISIGYSIALVQNGNYGIAILVWILGGIINGQFIKWNDKETGTKDAN